MHVQYVGFTVVDGSRTYNFHVIAPPEEARDFVVKVSSEFFRPVRLQFQDGPPIAFARLKRELDRETEQLHAESRLNIAEQDVEEYIQRQPAKARKK
ncbi:MAG: hypothetical protein HY648_13800 [Acidobacteria bacterium]|nr:hypothetical protein [Acidobacteriota bacterium]